jgi:hypothetical protein
MPAQTFPPRNVCAGQGDDEDSYGKDKLNLGRRLRRRRNGCSVRVQLETGDSAKTPGIGDMRDLRNFATSMLVTVR